MNRSLLLFRSLAVLGGLLGFSVQAAADAAVALTASANPEYTKQKYPGDQPRKETYVFMRGHYFPGPTVDRSIEQMPFRRIAEYLAPELAKQQYLPAMDLRAADLLLVVHWGTTAPRLTADQIRGSTTISVSHPADKAQNAASPDSGMDVDGMSAWMPIGSEADRQVGYELLERLTDELGNDVSAGTNAQLLGYTRELRRLGSTVMPTEKEITLRSDLARERYFIIIKAFDLRQKVEAGRSRKSVWTLHLNISSPGNNFGTALDRMSLAAVNYFGRTTDQVKTYRPPTREGKVTFAPLVILGEVK